VRAWDCRTSDGAATGGATPSLVMGGYVYFPTSMCVAPGSAHLLATGCKGFNGSGAEVKCWDARQPAKPLVEFLGHTHDVTACTFVHVGQGADLRPVDGFADAVLSCSKDGSVGLWNTITKQKMAFSSGMNKHFTSLAVLPSTSSGAAFDFAIGAYDGSLLLCTVVTAPQSGSPKTLPFSIVVNSSTAPYVSSMTENDIINRS
jgi:WD40 repeat protein